MPTAADPHETPFSKSVWTARTTIATLYASPLLDSTIFRPGGRLLRAGEVQLLYLALSRTPFVSVYGSSNWHDDVAELVAWYHLTQVLRQPYRIHVGSANSFEPMASELVRSRFAQLGIFYVP